MAPSTPFAFGVFLVLHGVAGQLAGEGTNTMTTTTTQLYFVEGALQLSSTGTQQEVADAARGALAELLGADAVDVEVTATAVEHPWINELHYDNVGVDMEEGFEIAGPAGTDLSNYKVVFYTGNSGAVYATENLTGVIGDFQNGYGAVWFGRASNGVQNGAPDGLALVAFGDEVVQFLSYEGSFAATDGPASGLTSTDIGVSESSVTPAGQSLQLAGNGSRYDDFTWQGPSASTHSAVNAGQAFSVPGSSATTPVANETTNESTDETANETTSEARRLTSAGRWRLNYYIVAGRTSAEELLEVANSLHGNVSAAAALLQEHFASRGLLLEGSSLRLFEPSLQAITATVTATSATTTTDTVRAPATAAAAEDEGTSLPLILGVSGVVLAMIGLGALVVFLVLRARYAKPRQDDAVVPRATTDTIPV